MGKRFWVNAWTSACFSALPENCGGEGLQAPHSGALRNFGFRACVMLTSSCSWGGGCTLHTFCLCCLGNPFPTWKIAGFVQLCPDQCYTVLILWMACLNCSALMMAAFEFKPPGRFVWHLLSAGLRTPLKGSRQSLDVCATCGLERSHVPCLQNETHRNALSAEQHRHSISSSTLPDADKYIIAQRQAA